ncbi:MAG: 4-hydroxy-tetrahydrodipicolinate synthase [Alphaproteobacteria bacterium]|nr:4-hydroxy-tetrahydrodipicolinate synthase [Alphaproteobacteria bacterium]
MSSTIQGVWLPVVTPFVGGEVDLEGYALLLEHYLGLGVSGIFPLGTTGESPTIDDDEMMALVEATLAVVDGRVPVFVGVGGNSTAKVVKTLRALERYAFPGIVSVCPYYNRPSQDGLRQHFTRMAEATDRQILIYNIPYRTAVNLDNDTLLALAELPNIVGVKDSSGNLAQSLDLLRRRPKDFAVMTGDDASFFTMLAHGADGGILAAAHLRTAEFVAVHQRMAANDHHGARAIWAGLEGLVPLLFREANPMPIKYCLWRQGLIRSLECRLPLTKISPALAGELDRLTAVQTARQAGIQARAAE